MPPARGGAGSPSDAVLRSCLGGRPHLAHAALRESRLRALACPPVCTTSRCRRRRGAQPRASTSHRALRGDRLSATGTATVRECPNAADGQPGNQPTRARGLSMKETHGMLAVALAPRRSPPAARTKKGFEQPGFAFGCPIGETKVSSMDDLVKAKTLMRGHAHHHPGDRDALHEGGRSSQDRRQPEQRQLAASSASPTSSAGSTARACAPGKRSRGSR